MLNFQLQFLVPGTSFYNYYAFLPISRLCLLHNISYGFGPFDRIRKDIKVVPCAQTRIIIRDDIPTATLNVDDDRMGRPGNTANIFSIGLTAAGYSQFQEITPFF